MPKVVDHDQRRRELAAAVRQVIIRDGVDGISIRSVAAASGWSSGALRHYLPTRADLLAFACEQVIAQVTERIRAHRRTGDPAETVRAVLLETMPVDEERHREDAIAFAFLALGLSHPELARVQRTHFTSMYELCLRIVHELAELNALASTGRDAETIARRMHAVVDGLTVHTLAGHLTADEMVEQLDAYLADLIRADLVRAEPVRSDPSRAEPAAARRATSARRSS